MIYNETYEIKISLDGDEIDYTPSAMAFRIKDSIFSLYPTASLNFQDLDGLFSEVLAFVNGTKVDIVYGLRDETEECSFTIIKNSVPDQANANSFGGNLEASLVHHYMYNQSKKSFAYKDEIGNIIKKLISTYNFKKVNIETTVNKGYWYQSLVNDAEFMNNYLLPFAYSTNSNTPFYLFINSANEFYFQSHKTLMNQNSVEELQLTSKGNVQSNAKNAIQGIYPYQTSISELRSSLHQHVSNFSKDGDFQFEEEIIEDFKGDGKLPLIANLDNVTDYYSLYSEDVEDPDMKNNNLGLSLFKKRNAFTLDKVVVVLPINRKLCSGKKVKVMIPSYTDKQQEETSARYSGEYLVESSYHIWDGSKGVTILILSRQSLVLPSTYRNSNKLIGA